MHCKYTGHIYKSRIRGFVRNIGRIHIYYILLVRIVIGRLVLYDEASYGEKEGRILGRCVTRCKRGPNFGTMPGRLLVHQGSLVNARPIRVRPISERGVAIHGDQRAAIGVGLFESAYQFPLQGCNGRCTPRRIFRQTFPKQGARLAFFTQNLLAEI